MRDQLGLGDEANSIIADRYATGSSARRGVAVGDLPTSSVSAVQLVPQTLCSEPTPPVPVNPPLQVSGGNANGAPRVLLADS